VSQGECPSRDELRRLLRGEVSEEEAAPLERHFAACSRCAGVAEALEAEAAPLKIPEHDRPFGERIRRLMRWLEALPVSSDLGFAHTGPSCAGEKGAG
jgi:anti-sigma factor RsiW